MLRRSAGWIAGQNRVPTSLRAVCGYYADSGVFDYGALTLKRRVDDRVAAMLDDAFAAVEAAIAEEFGRDAVDFSYDTKLVLPAKLTLGYLYRHLDETEHHRAEAMTQLSVEALVDGDIRDALNDDEFEDFEVDFPTGTEDRRVIAECAQAVLQERVEEQLSNFPDDVRDAYDWAVEISEAHQDEDDAFREMMAEAQDGDDAALASIRSRYKYADFDEEPTLFTEDDLEIPYLKTQYDRVGIIYDAMIEMYRSADLPIEPAFQRSIVLAIIGAQIWLDDIDDYEVDMADGQLTPVTAEYLLATEPETARDEIIDIGRTYLDRAKAEATVADSALTGIATEYIHRDGTPETLPDGESR